MGIPVPCVRNFIGLLVKNIWTPEEIIDCAMIAQGIGVIYPQQTFTVIFLSNLGLMIDFSFEISHIFHRASLYIFFA